MSLTKDFVPMNLCRIILAFMVGACLLTSSQSAQAKDDFQMAVGGSAHWLVRRDYGAGTFTHFSPELIVFGYIPFYESLSLRTGVRMGYSWEQPDMPVAIQIIEKDLSVSAEVGVVFDWYLVPSLTVGGGSLFRSLEYKTEAPISTGFDKKSRSQTLPLFFVQAGAGLPLFKGLVVAEPFFRYLQVKGDERFGLGYGVELTFQIF
jgi:hypothetical protein